MKESFEVTSAKLEEISSSLDCKSETLRRTEHEVAELKKMLAGADSSRRELEAELSRVSAQLKASEDALLEKNVCLGEKTRLLEESKKVRVSIYVFCFCLFHVVVCFFCSSLSRPR